MGPAAASLLAVRGIPTDWACADLRAFFAPEVERELFISFHFVHRLDAGSLCAFATLGEGAMRALVSKYDGRPWSEGREDCVCRLEPVGTFDQANDQSLPPVRTPGSRFRTRAQRREEVAMGAGAAAINLVGSSLALAELCPPSWLPRGNVGSSTAELRAALASCRLSARDLVALGLDVSRVVGGAAPAALGVHVSEPCVYNAGRPVRTARRDAGSFRPEFCAAGGPLRAGCSVAELRASARAAAVARGHGNCLAARGLLGTPGASRGEVVAGGEAGEDTDEAGACSDDAEEWDRHEATTEPGAWEANDRPTSAYWNSQNVHLFEEEIEHCWEKGGSGLAFYTDDAYWHAQTSAEERLVDGWDTHERDEDDGGAPSAPLPQLALEAHRAQLDGRERRRADADGPRAGASRKRALAGRPTVSSGAQAGEHRLALGASNLGYRLLSKMGWTPSCPALGKRNSGEVQPVAAQISHKRDRRGLG